MGEYLIDGCGAQAAIRSGVARSGAHVWASRTLRIVKVSEALQAPQATDATRPSLQREDVLNGLLEAVEQARLQSNPLAMIRGWAEIAKLMALGAPEPVKVDLSVQGEIKMRQMNELSDAELVKIITAGHAA